MDCLDLWVSPPLTPLSLVVIINDVPGAAVAPEMEGSQARRTHPPHSSTSYLVDGGGPGPLIAQSRYLKSPLLLPLLDPTPGV